ncbi:MAG: phenylalanine--tRNA ligase subunit beta [Patescibacteria group bacterium]
MYLSLNWLKDFVNIPKNISAEELGLRLTMHTVEIDSVEKQSEKYKDVVVGKVLEIKKHPKADKLWLVKVDIGKVGLKKQDSIAALQNDILSVVCGASNYKVGDFVPVALVGAVIPNGMEIKEVEVRGEKSCGMMCAEDELGMGEDHNGIIILDNKAKAGQNFGDYLGLKDVIYEVDNKSITHRPDLWSHYGMAREIGAFLNTRMATNVERMATNKIKVDNNKVKLKVRVNDFGLCPRYMAVAMDDIKIEESPKWLQERLIAVGQRPINNIVDITNYVMLELGQPLHAFAANLVDEIVVRRARKGEKMKTLDGQDRELDNETLVIADSKKPIAIAGVMGGGNSEINLKTKCIIIESANFNAISIRKTSQKLGLRTEASIRFEKFLDPNLCELAIARTVELIKKVCSKAEVASNLVDEKKFKLNQGPIKINVDWLNKMIGEKISKNRVIGILKSLGFKHTPVPSQGGNILVTVPTWRATRDISIPEDLVEEVARIYGYNNLKPQMPAVVMKAPEINEERKLERKIKLILAQGAKLTESYNYSFVCQEQLAKLEISNTGYIELVNPIASHQTRLRQSLLPNLLENIELNQSRYDKIGLFEIGNIFKDETGEINKDNKKNAKLPFQGKSVGIIVAGEKKDEVLIRMKGVVTYLLNSLNIVVEFQPNKIKDEKVDNIIKEMSLVIVNEDKHIAPINLLNNKIVRGIGIKKEVAYTEICLEVLFNLASKNSGKKYEEITKYPSVVRDLAFVVSSEVLYNNIRKEIDEFNELINDVELFDVFQGDKLGHNKKSLAFHISYKAVDRTLTAEEVDKLQEGLVKNLEKKFKAQIRNF